MGSSTEISYPLYMTHYAVIWIFGNYYYTSKPDTPHVTFVVSARFSRWWAWLTL